MPNEAKVVTVSDSVYSRTAEDKTGPALAQRLEQSGFAVVWTQVVPDDFETIRSALQELAEGFNGIVVTTGGTGFGLRDNTPEATTAVVQRQAPGLAEAMRMVNPLGRLSRATAGVIDRCLIVNTPGSSSGAIECLDAIIDVLPHVLTLLSGVNPHPHRNDAAFRPPSD